jgi:hypothetical protein
MKRNMWVGMFGFALIVTACGADLAPVEGDGVVQEQEYQSLVEAPSFACGTSSCNPTTQFCLNWIVNGNARVGCFPIPPGCGSRCSCILSRLVKCVAPESCTDTRGDITVTCNSD